MTTAEKTPAESLGLNQVQWAKNDVSRWIVTPEEMQAFLRFAQKCQREFDDQIAMKYLSE